MADKERIALHAANIYKSYAGVEALHGVTLALRPGEVHALLGVGGSGKSTLLKILCGVESPDAGQLYVNDQQVTLLNPRVAAQLGISAVHQEVHLLPFMTVAENILLDYAPMKRFLGLPVPDWSRLYTAAQEALDLLEVQINLKEKVKNLSLAQQQIIKIVRALSAKPRILLLDEPTDALTEIDISRLSRAIRWLVRRGTAVLYASSRLNEIPHVADRVSVIKEGTLLGTMLADEADLRAMVEMLVAETSQAMALREADRLRREFVSLVSHELRTPLAIIRGYAETIMSRPWSDEVRQECLENISSGCDRLTELVDNLLDISSLEKGTLPIEKEAVSLPDLTQRIVSTTKNQVKRKKQQPTTVALDFPPDFPIVQADPKRVEQVLHNLLDNAIKYSLPEGIVTISGAVDVEHRMVVVTVEDQGIGIPSEHLDRVFERFYRIPSPETVGTEGSGLGLAICKGIIDHHGGQIWVKSRLGQGSAFSFSLPLELKQVEVGNSE